jgi:hypothetical protein
MIPVFVQAKTVHALDRAATVIGFATAHQLQILFALDAMSLDVRIFSN